MEVSCSPLSSACLRRAGRLPLIVTVWLLGKPEGRKFLTPWSWEGKPGELPGEREKAAGEKRRGPDAVALTDPASGLIWGPGKRLKQAAVRLSGLGKPSGLGFGRLQRTQPGSSPVPSRNGGGWNPHLFYPPAYHVTSASSSTPIYFLNSRP